MEYIQLIWENWDDVCDFVEDENFIKGTLLDKNMNPTSNIGLNNNSSHIGLFVRIIGKEILVVENQYLIKEDDELKIMDDIVFNRKRKFRNLNLEN